MKRFTLTIDLDDDTTNIELLEFISDHVVRESMPYVMHSGGATTRSPIVRTQTQSVIDRDGDRIGSWKIEEIDA